MCSKYSNQKAGHTDIKTSNLSGSGRFPQSQKKSGCRIKQPFVNHVIEYLHGIQIHTFSALTTCHCDPFKRSLLLALLRPRVTWAPMAACNGTTRRACVEVKQHCGHARADVRIQMINSGQFKEEHGPETKTLQNQSKTAMKVRRFPQLRRNVETVIHNCAAQRGMRGYSKKVPRCARARPRPAL